MADIEKVTKLKSSDVGAALDFLKERIDDVFTNATQTKVNDEETNYTGGKGFALTGVQATAKISPADDGKSLLKISAKPKLTGLTITLLIIVGLIGSLFWIAVWIPFIVVIAIVWDKSLTKKKLENLLNDLSVRFS